MQVRCYGLLKFLPVDLEVREHLAEQALADFCLSVLDGCPAIPDVERPVGARSFGGRESNVQLPNFYSFPVSCNELVSIHNLIVRARMNARQAHDRPTSGNETLGIGGSFSNCAIAETPS